MFTPLIVFEDDPGWSPRRMSARVVVATVPAMLERRPFTWVRRRPVVADSLLAFVLFGLSVGTVAVQWGDAVPEGYRSADALRVALLVPGVAPVAFRRTRPLPALAVMVFSLLVGQGLAYEDHGLSIAVLIGAYSAAAYALPRPGRRVGAGFVAVLSSWVVVGMLVESPNAGPFEIVATNVFYGTAWILGDNVRSRRAHMASLEDRARRLEHERTLEDREARTRERAAIARELHDVVAHSVTVMVVQAAGARRALDKNPDAAAAALEVIEKTGRSSLVELRRILGVLRDDETPELVPQPSLARIGELASGAGDLPVEIHVTGEERTLPPTVDVSAFRIVQEALTNVRKHAGPRAKATVEVDFGERALTLRVCDDGRGAMTLMDDRSPGHGIAGMRERVAVCGGTLHSGPRVGGGWTVSALLPYEGSVP
jgi:signal transduction histidine kinase